MLAALDLQQEFWHLLRLVIALLQPVLVLILLGGLVLAAGHLLTMIGTRWGDHRASSKAMFFSVAMHLLLVGSLIALIPEYRAIEFLQMAGRDLEPIRVNVPAGNSTDVEDRQDAGPAGNGLNAQMRMIASGHGPEWSRFQLPPEAPAEMTKLEKPTEPIEQPQASAPDRPQPVEPVPSAQPETVAAAPEPAARMEPRPVPEPEAAPLPQQKQPETGPPGERNRSTFPQIATDTARNLERPDQGRADRPAPELTMNRQHSDSMVIDSPDAQLRRPDEMLTSRSDVPAPVGPDPQMLGQTAPPMPPSSTIPRRERLENRAPQTPLEVAGIGRVRPQSMNLPDAQGALSRPNENAAPPAFLPALTEQPELTRSESVFRPQAEGDRVPSVYRLRSEEERGKALLKFGGSQETEDAVDRSLAWMASVQNPAGYWHGGEYESLLSATPAPQDAKADVGITSLAVLAFLGKLHTVDQGEHSESVRKALHWIVSQQAVRHWGEGWGSTDGYLGGNASEFEAMYCHAMATFALAESFAMSRNSPQAQWLRVPLEKAVGFILDTQNVDGGWRYVKGQRESDMSIFGWQLMALKSAQAAGIQVDEQRLLRMRRFLAEQRIGSSGGLAGYRPREAANASAVAESLYCRQMLGMTGDTAAVQDAVRTILANLPRRSALNYYYWYYGTLALYQQGGPEWEQWNTAVRNMLVAEQRRTGALAGSWDPHDVWGGYGGRMYSTAIATLSLEVYYRYLPLYRLQDPASQGE
jgi:hypothetical protein